LIRGYAHSALNIALSAIEKARKTKSFSALSVTNACASGAYALLGNIDLAKSHMAEAIENIKKVPNARADWCWILANKVFLNANISNFEAEYQSAVEQFSTL
jgi:hypothetical protein